MSIPEKVESREQHHADQKPKRRVFLREKKLDLLDEIDRNPDDLGLILRREGLYSSQLYQWRLWRKNMGKPKCEKAKQANEMARVKRENARLKAKLERAERIIEIQKKTSELLNLPPLPDTELN